MILTFKNYDGKLLPYGNQTTGWMNKLVNHQVVDLRIAEKEVGSNAMGQTWRMWMKEVAAHMCHAGCTMPHYYDSKGNPHGSRPFNASDAHELFTSQFLGKDEEGDRLSWKMDSDGGVKVATKEQRLFAMDKFVVWATERGIPITIPRRGDYANYREMQER